MVEKPHESGRARLFWPLLCLIALALPLLTIPFFPASTLREKREESPFPRLLDADFPTAFEAWFLDHFGLRQELVTTGALLNVKILHTSPNEEVIVGTDGSLYYAATLADYTGSAPLTGAEARTISENLALLRASVERRGAKLYLAVAPNKNAVYPGGMPAAYPRFAGASNVQKLLALARAAGVCCVDLQPVLLNAARQERVYYRTDTHWNEAGAYAAADALLRAMKGEGALPVEARRYADFPGGDLAAMTGLDGRLSDPSPVYAYSADLPEADYAAHYVQVQGSGTGRLLMLRDSFGAAVAPLLANAYEETTLRWETPLYAAGPGDDVLILIAQRNIREYLLPTPRVWAPPVREALPIGAQADCQIELYEEEEGFSIEPLIVETAPMVWVQVDGQWYQATYFQTGWSAYLPWEDVKEDSEIRVLWQTPEGRHCASDPCAAGDLLDFSELDYARGRGAAEDGL